MTDYNSFLESCRGFSLGAFDERNEDVSEDDGMGEGELLASAMKRQKESVEIAYFISSLTDPKEVFSLIRDHWAVENNLHYCLDVILGEDQSLKRKDNEAKNWNIINKIVLFFLEKQKEKTKIPPRVYVQRKNIVHTHEKKMYFNQS